MSNDALIYQPNIVIKDFSLPNDYDCFEHGELEWSWEANQKGYFDTDLVYDEDYCHRLGDFIRGGKNIFHLEPELIALFKKTPIDEINLEDIVMPFDDFYIHFGKESQIFAPHYFGDLEGEFNKSELKISTNPIVGVFVHSTIDYEGINRGIDLQLIPEKHGDKYWSHAIDLPKQTDFKGEVVSGISNNIVEIFKNEIYRNPWANDLVNHRMVKNPKIAIDGNKLKKDWKPKVTELVWEETSLEVLKLVFNSILFITSPNSDVEEDYPSAYPEKLVKKARNGNAKEVKRAESKLASQGYTKIKFVGRSVKKYFQTSNTGTTVSTHWRRGHWRKQPFGAKTEGNKRLVWIKPTVVNKDLDTEKPMNGHIYEV